MKNCYELFDEARSRIPEHEARELLLWALQTDMSRLLMHFTDPAPDAAAEKFLAAVEARAGGKPLQYLTHVQNFCGLDLYVDERVLIPRYDTEVLVEQVLADVSVESAGATEVSVDLSGATEASVDSAGAMEAGSAGAGAAQTEKGCRPLRALDLCTGSGCIAIALAKLGGMQVTAGDISREALEVADRNARENGVEIIFYETDMFRQIPPERYDLITVNPPYIRSEVIASLGTDVRDYEPRLALDGDTDGLKFYRIIAQEAPAYLKKDGRLYLEIGYDQAEDVKVLLAAGGFTDITVIRDLSGLNRVVSARLSKIEQKSETEQEDAYNYV